jgi:hypothetical protein
MYGRSKLHIKCADSVQVNATLIFHYWQYVVLTLGQ